MDENLPISLSPQNSQQQDPERDVFLMTQDSAHNGMLLLNHNAVTALDHVTKPETLAAAMSFLCWGYICVPN
jgi:hypothetical protein